MTFRSNQMVIFVVRCRHNSRASNNIVHYDDYDDDYLQSSSNRPEFISIQFFVVVVVVVNGCGCK
ncbi:hypothetical protein DERF_009700 [Dermatophagoides farinae]|uniref:Uncharacterized protein n=1 Tax=Dermatophagoides farinae TaxID=6954 RepID=A0A922HVI4_DERFA|nr:hypothetical protein DERF_009700 [Dermatophagoides farinae]